MNYAADIDAHNIFSLAHPEFYETLAHYQLSNEFVDRLKTLLPAQWKLQRDDIWMHAYCMADGHGSHAPVVQGFKIHVSALSQHALQVLDIVVPICVQDGVMFKIAGDPRLLHLLNSKLQGRGQSGKFMTIYPDNEQAFKKLIEKLYLHTNREHIEGPYILSDQRYKDSKVLFYRYGGFRPPHSLNIDGTRTSYLVSPEGEYVADQRLPYFHLPDWVSDPCRAMPDEISDQGALLNDRFLVEGAISFSNAGGVYSAVDTVTERSVIIKEARPCTNCWNIGDRSWDAVFLLEREHTILQRLKSLDFVPAAIDLFKTWEHTFLVEEHIAGVSLDAYWAQDDIVLAPYIRRSGTIDRFVPKFRRIATALIRMMSDVHGEGVLFGDLSPSNIIIDAETEKIWFIDFESSVLEHDDAEFVSYATQWGTAGFMNPARASRTGLLPEDDFYAIAMILYKSVVPANYLFTLNPGAQSIFLDKFIDLGLPAEVKAVINSLKEGDVDAAKDTLARWEV